MKIELELSTKKKLELTEAEYEELKGYFGKENIAKQVIHYPCFPNYPEVVPYVYHPSIFEPTVTYSTTNKKEDNS